MKVLSIKEPFATLICNEQKRIETRSWPTKYRGEIYIHASVTKMDPIKAAFLGSLKPSPGYILCKANLKDCLYMTKEFIQGLKENNPLEYQYGRYEEGRYAWVIDDVTPLTSPLKAKGNLGIWNYYSLDDAQEIIKNIKLNDRNILNAPSETLKKKEGSIYDLVELQRYLLRNNYLNIKTYFCYCPDNTSTYAMLTYEDAGDFYWFKDNTITKYRSSEELLKAIKDYLVKEKGFTKTPIYEYAKPKYNISKEEFYNHCLKGNLIDI